MANIKKKIIRFFRYSFLFSWIFKFKITDYLVRRFLIRPFFDYKYYSNSSKNALHINNQINPLLKKYNGFLGHGLALLLIRDKKLPTYQDLDYDIYNSNDVESIIHDMKEIGFDIYTVGYLKNEIKFLNFHNADGHIVDFFLCDVKDNTFDLCTISVYKTKTKFIKSGDFYESNDYQCYTRKMTYTPIVEQTINGNKFFLPKNYDLYFSEMYGFDWTKVKKYYNWSLNPKNNMPKITKNVKCLISEKHYIEEFK